MVLEESEAAIRIQSTEDGRAVLFMKSKKSALLLPHREVGLQIIRLEGWRAAIIVFCMFALANIGPWSLIVSAAAFIYVHIRLRRIVANLEEIEVEFERTESWVKAWSLIPNWLPWVLIFLGAFMAFLNVIMMARVAYLGHAFSEGFVLSVWGFAAVLIASGLYVRFRVSGANHSLQARRP